QNVTGDGLHLGAAVVDHPRPVDGGPREDRARAGRVECHCRCVDELAIDHRAATATGICPVVGAVPMQLREAEDDQSGWRTLSTSRPPAPPTEGREGRPSPFVPNQPPRPPEAVPLANWRVLVSPVIVFSPAIVNRRPRPGAPPGVKPLIVTPATA